MSGKHTAIPWRVHGEFVSRIDDSNGRGLANTTTIVDARHIVKCVNTHDELVAALRRLEVMISETSHQVCLQIIRAALAKVQS